MIQEQSWASGGWGPGEFFIKPGSGELAETLFRNFKSSFETVCGSYAHFKLTRYLLRITRDSRYGDSMERVFYNTVLGAMPMLADGSAFRSEEHTSALQSLMRISYAVFCFKKKNHHTNLTTNYSHDDYHIIKLHNYMTAKLPN